LTGGQIGVIALSKRQGGDMPETPRVLIVDDEKRFRVTMLRLLKNNGISAKGVESGEQALEELTQNPYDVVLLDVKMPGISGIEVLRQMQKQGRDAEVIVLSGHASVDAAMEIMNFGAYDYLLKPCDIDDLLGKISLAHERKIEREKITRTKSPAK
jgi:DNA-binding NtrC family response regulator